MMRFTGIGRGKGDELLGRNFILLFVLSLCTNCYLSVYYCFEQWLEHAGVDPGWRGVLLGALFGMVMICRPAVGVAILRMRMRPVMLVSLLANTGVLLSYQFLPTDAACFEWLLLGLRVCQGFFLAVYSSCAMVLLVACIPPRQSARGFALFSLANLLPYALLPTVGELLLPILGGEPRLYAAIALLCVPSLAIMHMIGPALDRPQAAPAAAGSFSEHARGIFSAVSRSGLGWIYLTLLFSSLTTSTCLFFMKGLCSVTGEAPGRFYFWYCATMIVVRILFNRRLDELPRIPIVPVAGLVMGAATFVVAWGPGWAYEPFAVVYGLALSLLYPLTASTIYDRSPSEIRTASSILMMFVFDASSLFSPVIGGAALALGFGYRGVITLAAVFCATAGTLYAVDWLLRRRGGGER